jgi:hypothetical protein
MYRAQKKYTDTRLLHYLGIFSRAWPRILRLGMVSWYSMPCTKNNLLIGSLVIPMGDINCDIHGQRKKVLLEHRVRVALRRIVHVRVVQKILDAQENLEKAQKLNWYHEHKRSTYLFNSDCWLPWLLFVKDRKTDSSWRVDIWMKQRGREFTYRSYTHIQANVEYDYTYIWVV